jgi:two-component system osmolarity sensor histidine kinase EnvZ
LVLAKAMPSTEINPKSMERVVINLVENARRYGRPPIEIRTSADESWVHISIIDHGEGLTSEEATHLLKPFTRKNHSRTGISGTGLGLAIVDKIVRLHHGTLTFKKIPEQYFEVRVSLPISGASSLS